MVVGGVYLLYSPNMKMQPYTGFSGSGTEVRALAAVDVALYRYAHYGCDVSWWR